MDGIVGGDKRMTEKTDKKDERRKLFIRTKKLMLDQADILSATDRGQSIELYRQAQQIIYDDAPAIIAYDLNNVHCYRTSFQGFESNPAYPYTVFFYECTRAAG